MEAGVKEGMNGEMKYGADNVVLLACEHVREMEGESDVVVRRTRSVGAENAVLNAVRGGGIEPDWFVERWDGERKVLVACAVFDDAGKCGGFRKELAEYEAVVRGRGEEPKVRLLEDEAMRGEVAKYFSEEWARQRKEQMGKYGKVLEDAKASGEWGCRVVVGEYEAKGEDGKKAFGRVCEALSDAYPKDVDGTGGLVYSGYWDKGDVARFCFGVGEGMGIDALTDALDGIGARFYDPVMEGECEGVELEMAALVIAKMQTEEREKAAKEELAKEAGEAVERGMDGEGKKVDAGDLID